MKKINKFKHIFIKYEEFSLENLSIKLRDNLNYNSSIKLHKIRSNSY